jgi:2-polyprenyl-3-methyl-5-hydroxy-6-metoxy-1,4-benzoquinol methylase
MSQLISLELQNENGRANESLYRFSEFQDVAEMGCDARHAYLMSQTIKVHEHMSKVHTEILGVAGIYSQLLQTVPEENSWLWLLISSQERMVSKLNAYWTRAVALALDQHQCVVKELRDVLLPGVVRWKEFHGELMEMQWGVFAFGKYLDAKATDGPPLYKQMESRPVFDNVEVGNGWIFKLRSWWEDYAQQLLTVFQGMTASTVQENGAIRSHHQDEHGSFVTYEFLRRKTFGQWAIDKGLLRGLLRHVWTPPRGSAMPVTMGDFGAGGGHYSKWLNETGLIQAFAFDGTHMAAELTDGLVQEVNLVEEMRLWRTFDWVLCLEVGEHVPKQYSKTLLQNLRRHAAQGLIMSWSDDWEGIGHVNCLPREEFVALVQAETGFVLDEEATKRVKASCEIDYIARTIAVFRAP